MNKLLKYVRQAFNDIINFLLTTLSSFFHSFMKKKGNTEPVENDRELLFTYPPCSTLTGDQLLPQQQIDSANQTAAATSNNEDSDNNTPLQSILERAEADEAIINTATSSTNTSTSSSGVVIPKPGNRPVLIFRGIGSRGGLQERTQGLINAGGAQGYKPLAMQANNVLHDFIHQYPNVTELHLYGFSRGNHILLHSLQTINHKYPQIKKISACLIDPVHGVFNQIGYNLPLEYHSPPKKIRTDLNINYYALISAGSNNPLIREVENIALPKTTSIISAVPTDNLFFAPGGHTETPYSTNANKLAQLIQLKGGADAVPAAFFGTTENPEEIEQRHVEHVLSSLGNLYNIPCSNTTTVEDLKRELQESSNWIRAEGSLARNVLPLL